MSSYVILILLRYTEKQYKVIKQESNYIESMVQSNNYKKANKINVFEIDLSSFYI